MQPIVDLLRFYIKNFYLEDYFLLLGCVMVFFVILMVAVWMRQHPTAAVGLIIVAFCSSASMLFYGERALAEHLRSHELAVSRGKVLAFSHNIYFNLSLKNTSKRHFSICRVHIRLQKRSFNYLQEIINYLRPLARYEVELHDIRAGELAEKELVLAYYLKNKNFLTKSRAVCF